MNEKLLTQYKFNYMKKDKLDALIYEAKLSIDIMEEVIADAVNGFNDNYCNCFAHRLLVGDNFIDLYAVSQKASLEKSHSISVAVLTEYEGKIIYLTFTDLKEIYKEMICVKNKREMVELEF